MHRLIEFIKHIYVLLIFLLLEGAALWFYANSTPYTESHLLARTTAAGGAVSTTITDIQHYFSLSKQNKMLTERIAELEQHLGALNQTEMAEPYGVAGVEPTTEGEVPVEIGEDDLHYRYYAARVASITTNRQRNYIVLDKGTEDGIKPDMGVITPNRELIGYIVSCSPRYSVVLPILNTSFRIGGRIAENDYVCSVSWSGESRFYMQAVELSPYSEPREGMAINVESDRLPKDVLIGHIESFKSNDKKNAYSAVIRLAHDMSNVDNVLIVENTHFSEIEELIDNSVVVDRRQK